MITLYIELVKGLYWFFRDLKEKPEQTFGQPSSVQFSHSVMSNSLRPHELQHTRPPCPSPTPGVHTNSGPLSRWCHPSVSSSVVPFSSCPQSLPASESFPMSQLFAWGGQRIGVSALASFLPKNTQGWSSESLCKGGEQRKRKQNPFTYIGPTFLASATEYNSC